MQAENGGVSQDPDDLRAARAVEAVVCEAHYMADLTVAFLRGAGYRPRRNRKKSGAAEPEDSGSIGQAKGFLLNLAAAIRIAVWEHAGFRPHLPSDVHSLSEASRHLIPPPSNEPAADTSSTVPELARTVFRVQAQQFLHSGRKELGTDVLLPLQAPSEDELLEGLADLLWNNRHLVEAEEYH